MVKRYGVRLLPELYDHLNPMPFEAAARMEMDLAEDLRKDGYTAWGTLTNAEGRLQNREWTRINANALNICNKATT